MIAEARRVSGRTSSGITKEILEDDRDDRGEGRARRPSHPDAASLRRRRHRRSPHWAEECRQKTHAVRSNNRHGPRTRRSPDARTLRGEGGQHDGRRHGGDQCAQRWSRQPNRLAPAATKQRPQTGRPETGQPGAESRAPLSGTTASTALAARETSATFACQAASVNPPRTTRCIRARRTPNRPRNLAPDGSCVERGCAPSHTRLSRLKTPRAGARPGAPAQGYLSKGRRGTRGCAPFFCATSVASFVPSP
jgi:hypothetical protein